MELHKDDLIQRERQMRQQIILNVQKELNGEPYGCEYCGIQKREYWKLLTAKLQAWIAAADKRRIDLLDKGITESNLRLLNDEKVKMEAFAQVLRINEAIIYENTSWLERFKEPIKRAFDYVRTFVGPGRNGDVSNQEEKKEI